MASVRLPESLETRLEHLAALTKRSKSFFITEALTEYLEDMEDAYIALERIATPKRTYSSSQNILPRLSDETLQRFRKLVAQHIPKKLSLADELIAEREAQASHE